MEKEMTTSKYNLKYALPTALITIIVLFLVTAGINAVIQYLFDYFQWSNNIAENLKWGVTIIVFLYFIYRMLKNFGVINKTSKEQAK